MVRSIDDLESHAIKFWPESLARQERNVSIIPRLIETQEKFIGILYVSNASPFAWKRAIDVAADMPANLFLKHLIVLADIGGEKLVHFRKNILKWFPERTMAFHWSSQDYSYSFKSLHSPNQWDNKSLQVDGRGLRKAASLNEAIEDVAMLLLHGGASTNFSKISTGILEKCAIGTLIGQKPDLDTFVRQRYIYVSRVTGGAAANAMGQLCQSYVREQLQNRLSDWDFSGHVIPGISQNAGRTDTSFDIVARSPANQYCAIEVSFQVTTNSTIERKAGQARDRQRILHRAGHMIAYVIDGAGNFRRRSALKTICQHSDHTSAFTDGELDGLAQFLRSLST